MALNAHHGLGIEMIQVARTAPANATQIEINRAVFGTVAQELHVGTVLSTVATPVYQNQDLSDGLPLLPWPFRQWWVGLIVGLIFGYLIRLVS